MENQNSSYSVQIGKTTFIVCVKQSETAKKPIEKMFKDRKARERMQELMKAQKNVEMFFADNRSEQEQQQTR